MFLINQYLLCVVLLIAAYFDVTQKKIPNIITFPVMLWGLLSYIVSGGSTGFFFSLFGLLVGLAVFFIPFVLGGMGAGDVKLMGAIGALTGAEFVLPTALIAILVGGVMATVCLTRKKQLLPVLLNVVCMLSSPLLIYLAYRFRLPSIMAWKESLQRESKKDPLYLPYGVAISLGAIIALTNIFPHVLVY